MPGMGWRVYTVDTFGPLRTWYEVVPVHAAGPTDPAVPDVRIFAVRLTELGFCADPGPAAGRIDSVRIWLLGPGGPTPVQAPRLVGPPPDGETGMQFMPPDSRRLADAFWNPGRYILAIGYGSASTETWWFGVEIVAAPAVPAASPAPGTSQPAPGATRPPAPGPSPVAGIPRRVA